MAAALRVGIMSTAGIASKNFLAASAAPGVEVVAVSSRSMARAQAWADERKIPKAYGSHAELLADPDVDAVYIPMPTGVRCDMVAAAAKAGKHVLSEKPIAPTVVEAEQMLVAVRAAGVVFMDGIMFMHSTRLAAIKAAIDAPAFGKVTRVVSEFSFPADEAFMATNIRVDPQLEPLGALGDLGVYNIRMAMFAFGWELPKSVSMLTHGDKDGVPLDCSAVLQWADGRSSTFACSFCTQFRQSAAIVGANQAIELDDFVLSGTTPTTAAFTHVKERGMTANAMLNTRTAEEVEVTAPYNQEVAMWVKFAELCHSGSDADKTFYREVALNSQKILNGLMDSAAKDGAVTVL